MHGARVVRQLGLFSVLFSCGLLVAACSNKGGDDDQAAPGAGSGFGGTGGSGNTTSAVTGNGTGGAGGGGTGTGGATAGGGSGGSQAMATGGSAAAGGAGGTAASGGTGAAGTAGSGTGAGTGGDGGAAADAGSAAGGASGSGGGNATTPMPGDNPTPSAGCGAATWPDSGRTSIDVGGVTREYILTLPDGYDPNVPYRLIFAWHGHMYSADWVVNGDPPQTGPYFGIESEANGNAIFVAPQALNTGFGDITFVDAMREKLEAELCIDQSRIFSVGFSMGAMMTLTIGCQEGDVFRGIAPMSGQITGACSTTDPPVAYWGSHGNMDTTILPSQGEAARDTFVKRNHCSSADPMPTEPSGCVSYQGCDAGYPVTWCPFDGVHEPPKFAGAAIWGFLSQL